jgi:hypothetical protein
VCRYPKQPRPQLAHLRASPERQPCVQQGKLQDVLGSRVRQADAPAVAQQRAPVAVHERLEGTLVPFAHEPHQPLVGLDGQ